MLSFMNLNQNRNNGNDLNQVFTKQGTEFNRSQQKIQQQTPVLFQKKENLSSSHSKKQGSFFKTLEGFQTYSILNDNNEIVDKKKLLTKEYISKHIDESKKETIKSHELLNTAKTSLQESTASRTPQNMQQKLSNYETYNNQLIQQTNDYLSNENSTKNINVYVNSFYDEKYKPLTIYKGLFNNDSENANAPVMDILEGNYNYEKCNDIAYRLGKPYFGLTQSSDTDGVINSKCGLSDNTDYMAHGYYTEKCIKATDDNMYGLKNINALYRLNDPQNDSSYSYIGCYKDNKDAPSMTSTGFESNDGSVYQSSFNIGNYGEAPWGGTVYSDGTPFPVDDNKSVWIWNIPDASSNWDLPDTGDVPILFVGQYTQGESYQYVNIHGMCDNASTITVNGSSTHYIPNDAKTMFNADNSEMSIVGGWGTNGNPIYTVLFRPGVNTIEVLATNAGGPAGLFLSITNYTNDTVLMGTDSNWMYSTKVTKYYPPESQSFDVNLCAEYAKTYGYSFFGLQNILNSNFPNSAQCFVTNSEDAAEQYGVSVGSMKDSNGKVYGMNESTSVYQMSKVGDAAVMGSVGYINEQNQLSPYPSSMLTPGTQYDILNNYNSQSSDINTYNASVNPDTGLPDTDALLNDCMTNCNADDTCNGFVLNNSTNSCILKQDMYGPSTISGPLNYDENYTLYMRKPEIINNDSSCPTRLLDTNSLQWDSYTKSANEMSSSTKCSLAEINQKIMKKRDELGISIDNDASDINNNINNFIQLSGDLSNQVNVDGKMVDTNLSIYNQIYNQYRNALKNGTTNLDNILTNSQISVLQSNSIYILWVVLALLIISVTIYIFRKFIPTNPVTI